MTGIDEIMSAYRGEGADGHRRDELARDRQVRFEDGVVAQLLTFAQLDAARMRRERLRETDGGLTLEWFNREFPGFPVVLGAEKLPRITDLLARDFFGAGFMKLPMLDAYKRLCLRLDVSPQQERVGLVFSWPHNPAASTMVLHNYPIELHKVPDPACRMERNTRFVRVFGDPPVVYVFDPLPEFLLCVGTDWINV